jgi:hypothetical protein
LSITKVTAEFGVSQYIVRKGRPLHKNLWHSSWIWKEERSAFVWCCYTVIQFYENEYSYPCPGKKDFMSVKQQHETTHREHGQKRLVLCNLQELYVAFCEKHTTISIGFSKLAELCPKHCILAGARGTHTVCVCDSLEHNTHGTRSTPYSWFECKKPSWKNDMLNRK